jgi:dolichol-phosphate mannosyltransferase
MKALVIVPTYNEVDNIKSLIQQVLEVDDRLHVLVVDDNSQDGTGDVVEEMAKHSDRVHALHRPAKLGLGTAYVAGFQYALKSDYGCAFEMDADFSHDPAEIPTFLSKIEKYDLVIGSRYLDGVSVINWPMTRLLLSYLANLYARVVTGVPVKDLTGGFKCFRRSVLEAIDLSKVRSDGYAFQIEMNFKSYHEGFRLIEIPIIFVERRAGVSKMSKKIIWEAFWLVWRLRLNTLKSRFCPLKRCRLPRVG